MAGDARRGEVDHLEHRALGPRSSGGLSPKVRRQLSDAATRTLLEHQPVRQEYQQALEQMIAWRAVHVCEQQHAAQWLRQFVLANLTEGTAFSHVLAAERRASSRDDHSTGTGQVPPAFRRLENPFSATGRPPTQRGVDALRARFAQLDKRQAAERCATRSSREMLARHRLDVPHERRGEERAGKALPPLWYPDWRKIQPTSFTQALWKEIDRGAERTYQLQRGEHIPPELHGEVSSSGSELSAQASFFIAAAHREVWQEDHESRRQAYLAGIEHRRHHSEQIWQDVQGFVQGGRFQELPGVATGLDDVLMTDAHTPIRTLALGYVPLKSGMVLSENGQCLLEQEAQQFLKQEGLEQKVEQIAPPTISYNCHGFTFAGGVGWIAPEWGGIEQILHENSYQLAAQPQVGDLIVYRNPEMPKSGATTSPIMHTGIVTRVERLADDRKKVVEICSKWDRYGLYWHAPDDVPAAYGKWNIYRSDRNGGHLLLPRHL